MIPIGIIRRIVIRKGPDRPCVIINPKPVAKSTSAMTLTQIQPVDGLGLKIFFSIIVSSLPFAVYIQQQWRIFTENNDGNTHFNYVKMKINSLWINIFYPYIPEFATLGIAHGWLNGLYDFHTFESLLSKVIPRIDVNAFPNLVIFLCAF